MGEITFLEMNTTSALASCSKKCYLQERIMYPQLKKKFEGWATPSPAPRNTFVGADHALTRP